MFLTLSQVIHKHFWMKRCDILNQCEKWLQDLVVTCSTDRRAGRNVTGGADPVTWFKVIFIADFSYLSHPNFYLCRYKLPYVFFRII